MAFIAFSFILLAKATIDVPLVAKPGISHRNLRRLRNLEAGDQKPFIERDLSDELYSQALTNWDNY